MELIEAVVFVTDDGLGALKADVDGVITWNLTDIAPDDTVTVSFDVKVTGTDDVIENKATVLEGTNTYETNTVTNPIDEDEIVKDVFHVNEPTISIDGDNVKKDDVLLYKITYVNSDDFDADVTITDVISEHTTYVEGSADNGGTYGFGKLTCNLELEAGESKTVSFKVKVVDTNVTFENRAKAIEDSNELDTNIVKNPVPAIKPTPDPDPTPDPESHKTGDNTNLNLWFTLLFISSGGIIVTTAYGIKRNKLKKIK